MSLGKTASAVSIIALSLCAAQFAAAQDTLVERTYEVKSLVVSGNYPIHVPLWGSWWTNASSSIVEEPSPPISADSLLSLIKNAVEPASWDMEGRGMAIESGNLTVTQTEAVHSKLAEFLRLLQSAIAPTVTVEARVLKMNEATFRKLSRREGKRGIMVFDAKEAEKLLAENAVTPEASCGTAGRSGEPSSCESATTFSYIEDYDVEIAEDAAQCDPIIGQMDEGVSLLVRPMLDRAQDTVTLEIECETLTLNGPIETFAPGAEHVGDIMLPDATMSSFATTVSVPLGKTALVCGTGFRHDASDTEGSGTYAVLLTPHVATDCAPLKISKDVSLGIFNVQSIVAPARHFITPGMANDALSPHQVTEQNSGNDQPPTGEGQEMFNGTAFLDDLPQTISPSASSAEPMAGLMCGVDPELVVGTNVFSTEGSIVVACKPDTLAKAGAFLREQALRRSRMMETELYVLSLDGKFMAQTLGGAAVSGAIPPEIAEALLKEAAAGQQASVVGHVMLTSTLGRWASAAQTRVKRYVKDYDVEIATGVSIADPIPSDAIEGVLLSIAGKPCEDAGKLHVGGKVDLSRFVRPIQTVDIAAKGHGKIQLPVIHSVSVPFNVRTNQDEFTLLGTYAWPTETGEKKTVVVLLRAAMLQ